MVYVTADLHGEETRLKDKALRRLGKRDTLIILGDFGFIWSGGDREKKVLRRLGRRRFTTLFLDGAHENYDLLANYPEADLFGGKADRITGRLYHAHRGELYQIEGRSFLCIGGGESTDIDTREEGRGWWRRELPDAAELRHCFDSLEACGYKVDYILTHTPPYTLRRFLEGESADVNSLEIFLDEVMKKVQYVCWYFGRCHRDQPIGQKAAAVYCRVVPLWKDPKKKLFHR